MVNLGMIGVGSLRETGYLEALRTLETRLQVRAVYDPVFARAQQVASELGAVAAGGLLALARRCDIRALLVLDGSWILPGALSLLASTGKPLLVAGNPAENAASLCQLRQVAGDRGQTVVPELDLRYSPATFRLQELMATRLGRPCEIIADVCSRAMQPEPGAAGLSHGQDALDKQQGSAILRSGMVVSLADWCRNLFGSPPIAVETRCSDAGPPGTGNAEQAVAEELPVCEVHANFASRAGSEQSRRVVLRLFQMNGGASAAAAGTGTRDAFSSRRADETGSGALWMARVVCENGAAEIVGSNHIRWSCSGQEEAVVSEELSDDRPGRVVMLDHFCRRVVGGLIPVADIQDVCRSIRFVDAACDSLYSGQPVSLAADLPHLQYEPACQYAISTWKFQTTIHEKPEATAVMRDHVRFFAEFRRRFHTTGAIAPSSRFLGRALSRSLATPAAPRRILEVGPGTGAVTREIIRRLQPGDTLDLVELNEAFVRHLEERFESDAAFRPVRGQCRVHHLPLEDMPASEPYDCIISGLPLNNFSPEVVRSIFARIFELLAPGGTLSYFEYMFVRGIRGSLARGAERQRLQGLEEIIGPLLRQHRVRRDWIFRNLPPAWVQHLQIAAEAPVPEPAREVDPAAEAPAGTGEFRS